MKSILFSFLCLFFATTTLSLKTVKPLKVRKLVLLYLQVVVSGVLKRHLKKLKELFLLNLVTWTVT